jgi:CRISPR type III-A-associated protein Csm2
MGKHFKAGTSSDDAGKYLDKVALLLDLEKASVTDIKTGVETVEDMIKDYIGNTPVKSHQVRNIFSLVKENDDTRDLNLIRPKLAYIGARQTSKHGKVIVKVIDGLIVKVTNENDDAKKSRMLRGLKYIVECIVAYHKFHVKD